MPEPTDAERLDWLSRHVVDVRVNLMHGSRRVFLGVPGGDEETTMDEPWDIRGEIDKAMRSEKRASRKRSAA